jgi:hypothetical protein
MSDVSVTDEVLDAYVNRPLAAKLVALVAPVRWVTPNTLTAVSAVMGTLAGVALVHTPAAAAVLLFGSMVIDCGDGQLARVRGGGTVLGRILDGYADYWVALCLHVGLVFALVRSGVTVFGAALSPLAIFALVLAAGVSQALHAGHFDFEKRRFWAYTGVVREPETPETYLRAASESRGISRLLLRAFAVYVRAQQADATDTLVREARATASDPESAARYKREHAWLVRLWSLFGPTSHNGLLLLVALVAAVHPGALVFYCVVALVVVNVLAALVATLEKVTTGRFVHASR